MVDDDVRAVAEDVGFHADGRDQPGMAWSDPDVLHRRDRLRQRAREVVVRRGELIGELVVAEPEGGVTLGDQHTLVRVEDALDVDAKAETVEQLRAELTLLRIHGADEDEPRRVRERHPLPLDDVDPHGGGIQEHVHDVVVEEVHLVDVEDVAVRLGQHARLEAPRPGAQRSLDVDRAHDAVLG